MSVYEFKIVPAPRKGLGRAIFRPDPAAMTLPQAVNALAEDGWTFLRTDERSLPSRTRLLFGMQMQREVLVFRRPRRRPSPSALGLGRMRADNPGAFAQDVRTLLEGFQPLNSARAA